MATLTFGAPISSQYAQQAVQAWLRTDAHPLDSRMGQILTAVETYNDTQGLPLYYVVYLQPSGYAIVPADDLIEPIIAFAAQGHYDPSPDNPLGALVSNDLPDRMQRVREQAGGRTEGALKKAGDKWGVLRGIEKMASGVELGISNVSDVRVPPLVQSLWNQRTVGGVACYNYYTPPYASGSAANYYCGCVATAMAQLMRYHQHPVNGVGTTSFTIYIKGTPTTRSLRGGDGSGGAYSWSDMTLDPSGGVTDIQRQAIGALTQDAGVSVNMDYGDAAYGGSGANTLDAKDAFVNTFGYNNAIKGYNSSDTIGAGLNGMVNPNLDAGYPVLFGITGTPGGHAIVGDGYGYNLGTLYHHLNLGWSGTDNAWYNLPTIETSNGTFTSVYKCVYNVYVTGSGEIISGRVADNSGAALTNATVTAVQSGGGTYTTNTNARGIYAFPKVPSASHYTVSVVKAGYTFTNRSVNTGTSVDNEAVSGNSWAADFRGSPRVCADYDGDGKSDPAVYVDAAAQWSVALSGSGYALQTIAMQGSGSLECSADYDGDGKADPAVYQPEVGQLLLRFSSQAYAPLFFPMGGIGCVPVVGDFDGDWKADPAVYSAATGQLAAWLSGGGYAVIVVPLGGSGWSNASADYDRDGKADPAVVQTQSGQWQFLFSSQGYTPISLATPGSAEAEPAPGDYDGDGKADPALYQAANGLWMLAMSSQGYSPVMVSGWGAPTMIPRPADYDGDGKTDPAVYAPGLQAYCAWMSGSGYNPTIWSW